MPKRNDRIGIVALPISTPTFSLMEDEAIMEDIFRPLASGLIGIIWLAFAVWFIKRLQHIVL